MLGRQLSNGTHPETTRWLYFEIAVLLIWSAALAFPLRGHFLKPHLDFCGFNDAADNIIAGWLTGPHKRAPLYPIMLAVGGELAQSFATADRPPRVVFAEWLNAGLLPVNAVLVLLIARRALVSRGHSPALARWVAAAFVLLPLGLWSSAHLLVEPLLTTTMLLTVLAASHRRRGFAYLLAMAATMTRYDAAGLILGLMIADGLAGRRWEAIRNGLAALLPLLAWLALTAFHWQREAGEHYLQQIAERPYFAPVSAAKIMLDACFSPSRIPLPVWVDFDEAYLRLGFRAALAMAILWGAFRSIGVRDRAAIVALLGVLAYGGVHALFPFQFERFGIPCAPLLLVFAAVGVIHGGARMLRTGSGIHNLDTDASALRSQRAFRFVLTYALVVFFGILIAGSLELALSVVLANPTGWFAGSQFRSAPWLLFLAFGAPRGWRMANWAAGIVLLLWLAPLSLREAEARLGTGADRANLATAARWIVAHVPADAGVLTDLDGLIRLYLQGAPRRTVSFRDIEADAWPAIGDELRRRGVRTIVWHECIHDEFTHELYMRPWRLERFSSLVDAPPPGVELVEVLHGDPDIYVFRLR